MELNIISKELGLAAIGSAKAGDLDAEYRRLLDWIMHGYHGKMEWLAKSAKRRCYTGQLMAQPRSVIVCAMRYEDIPLKRVILSEAKDDKIPQYLRHEDYHAVMMEKLEALTAEIKKKHPEAKFKCYVDTGPVLEKAWAQRAGIGFVGKNTLLIMPGVGSQVALGVVITDVPNIGDPSVVSLPQDDNETGCKDCTACIDACPHHALVAPYMLDARKCVSYKYFIEKREGGCDICQDVCPFNSATRRRT